MEKLSEFINQELKDVITSVQVYQGTSKESKKPYYAVDLKFNNGYLKRLFLNNEETFAWVNAFELLQTQKQVEAAF